MENRRQSCSKARFQCLGPVLIAKQAPSKSATPKADVKPSGRQGSEPKTRNVTPPRRTRRQVPAPWAKGGGSRSKRRRPWELRAQDWDALIIDSSKLAQTIDEKKGELKGITWVPNGGRRVIAENMVVGAGHRHALLVIVPGKTGINGKLTDACSSPHER